MARAVYWAAVREALAFILALAGLVMIVRLVAGCSGARPAEAAGAYMAEQLRCVDQAASLPQAEFCREGVRRRWGVTDGGAR